jgi:hypothetical protein
MILLNSEKQCIYMHTGRRRMRAAAAAPEEEEKGDGGGGKIIIEINNVIVKIKWGEDNQ